MLPPIRVAVFSDDRLFSEGLLRILAAEPSVTAVDRSGERAAALPRRPIGSDVMLLDSRLEGALEVCAALRNVDGPAVILVAAPDDEVWAEQALGTGARGLLAKSARSDTLLQAVRVVQAGGVWAPREVMARCIERLTAPLPAHRGAENVLHRLSRREREVFRHAASGLSNKELAERLAISRATVKAHLTQVFQKLGVSGRAHLAAVYHGLAPMPARTAGVPASAPTVVRLKA